MRERRDGHCRHCNMRVVKMDDERWWHWTPGEYNHQADVSAEGGGDFEPVTGEYILDQRGFKILVTDALPVGVRAAIVASGDAPLEERVAIVK